MRTKTAEQHQVEDCYFRMLEPAEIGAGNCRELVSRDEVRVA
jgi:hypothetical protein